MRGNNVMKGYFDDVEATAEAFRGGWFHSGDLAVRHPDGYVELRDRAKDIIISGGENISTIEVEQAIAGHPAVLECAVVSMPDEQWGERPKAFVTLKPGAEASEREIIDFCRERLAHFKCPAAVELGRAAEDLDREDPEVRAAGAGVGGREEEDRRMTVYRSELTPLSFLRRSAAVVPRPRRGRPGGPAAHLPRARRGAPARSPARSPLRGSSGATASPCSPRTRPRCSRPTTGSRGAGAVLVALNVRLGAAEIAGILEHSGARLLLVDRELEQLGARRRRHGADRRHRRQRTTRTSSSWRRAIGPGRPDPSTGRKTRKTRSRSTTRPGRPGGRRASCTRIAAPT